MVYGMVYGMAYGMVWYTAWYMACYMAWYMPWLSQTGQASESQRAQSQAAEHQTFEPQAEPQAAEHQAREPQTMQLPPGWGFDRPELPPPGDEESQAGDVQPAPSEAETAVEMPLVVHFPLMPAQPEEWQPRLKDLYYTVRRLGRQLARLVDVSQDGTRASHFTELRQEQPLQRKQRQ